MAPVRPLQAYVRFHERSVQFRSAGSVWLGPALAASEFAAWFAPQTETAVRREFIYRDVVLDGGTLGHWWNGKPIGDPPPPSGTPIGVDEPIIMGCNKRWQDYAAWLTECLPAIDWALARDDAQNLPLALPDLLPWQEDTLHRLGHAAHPRLPLRKGLQYHTPELRIGEFLNDIAPFESASALLPTLHRLAATVEPATGAERVFVLPMDGGPGNLFALADRFRAAGFRVFVPDPGNVAEQIAMFRAARQIVGPASAALANIGFCAPGTVVCEFLPAARCDPRHQRLAQIADLHYRAESFPVGPGGWTVPPDGLDWVWNASTPAPSACAMPRFWRYRRVDAPPADELPLDRLLLEFESLGEDCEFGLVQRDIGLEPLGLLRFGGFAVAWETRLAHLTAAIDAGFAGLGDPASITIAAEGQPGEVPELLARESRWNLLFHTFRRQGEVEPDDLVRQQSTVMRFLRRKFLTDVQAAEKIWVWKPRLAASTDAVLALLQALKRHGPNRLLWAAQADADHPVGTVECVAPDLVRGFVAPPVNGDLGSFAADGWLTVCRDAYAILRRQPAQTET